MLISIFALLWKTLLSEHLGFLMFECAVKYLAFALALGPSVGMAADRKITQRMQIMNLHSICCTLVHIP
jgi:hypothetical protein